MSTTTFQILKPTDIATIALIADWYLSVWNIPKEKTTERLQSFTEGGMQFQVVMLVDNEPVATCGLYNHISLIDKMPRFGVHKHWLAVVYTTPENRRKGYAAMVCEYLQNIAKNKGIKELHLFTDNAEALYTKLGWVVLERFTLGERNIVVMHYTHNSQ